jgi:hypothetical protein
MKHFVVKMFYCLGLIWAAIGSSQAQAGAILTLSPSSGTVSGLAGESTGWGFTIFNDEDYIEITSAQFCVEPVSFPVCLPSTLGTFTDFISVNGLIVGPGETVSEDFDPGLLTGVGMFDIDPSAAEDSIDLGQIVLTFNVYSLHPDDPDAELKFTDQVAAADAGVMVGAPEPQSLALVLAGFLAILLKLSKRRASI